MRNSNRVTELEAKTQKSVSSKVVTYFCSDGICTTEDGKEISREEIDQVSDENIKQIIVTFV